jgi:hypothetical protein
LEYVNLLLEAIQEAQQQVQEEVALAASPRAARRKQALQLASYKLDRLSAHVTGSRRVLNDLRTLRRLLLEERQSVSEASVSADPQPLAPKLAK